MEPRPTAGLAHAMNSIPSKETVQLKYFKIRRKDSTNTVKLAKAFGRVALTPLAPRQILAGILQKANVPDCWELVSVTQLERKDWAEG